MSLFPEVSRHQAPCVMLLLASSSLWFSNSSMCKTHAFPFSEKLNSFLLVRPCLKI